MNLLPARRLRRKSSHSTNGFPILSRSFVLSIPVLFYILTFPSRQSATRAIIDLLACEASVLVLHHPAATALDEVHIVHALGDVDAMGVDLFHFASHLRLGLVLEEALLLEKTYAA